MTRRGTGKTVDGSTADGRLRVAQGFLKAARVEAAMADEGDIGNPVMSQVVNAAIAYTDALTAKYAGIVNQKDHSAAVKALKTALGNRLPTAQETNLRRILSMKDEVQYGARLQTGDDARRLLERLEEFANWAEVELRRPR